jgi:hypothetical protein
MVGPDAWMSGRRTGLGTSKKHPISSAPRAFTPRAGRAEPASLWLGGYHPSGPPWETHQQRYRAAWRGITR